MQKKKKKLLMCSVVEPGLSLFGILGVINPIIDIISHVCVSL